MVTSLNDLNLDIEVGAAVDEYEKPSNSFRPPEPGEYTFIRSSERALEWKSTEIGDIYTSARFLIQGGEMNGKSVFDTLGTYVGKFRKASTIQDYLAACGFEGEPENGKRFTAREIIEAVEQTFGPFDAYSDWQGYCAECGKTVLKGSKDFPRDDEGRLLHEAECPECGAKVVARARIKRYIVR